MRATLEWPARSSPHRLGFAEPPLPNGGRKTYSAATALGM